MNELLDKLVNSTMVSGKPTCDMDIYNKLKRAMKPMKYLNERVRKALANSFEYIFFDYENYTFHNIEVNKLDIQIEFDDIEIILAITGSITLYIGDREQDIKYDLRTEETTLVGISNEIKDYIVDNKLNAYEED